MHSLHLGPRSPRGRRRARALAVLPLVICLGACDAPFNPCSRGSCPELPGCENESPITCDPDHICSEQVCEGVGWICGVVNESYHVWRRTSAPCDDGDPCTTDDLCVQGRCEGSPLTCSAPPASSCMDADWLRVHARKGTCVEGRCTYEHSDHRCPEGCRDGECTGYPCTGISCDNPPGPCYAPTGTCVAGQCQYDPLPVGTVCDPGDKCVSEGACDEQHRCTGTVKDCQRPHTTGGTCVAGACQGYKCETGFGDCNDDLSDGCETALNVDGNCGKCGRTCDAVPHATTSCSSEGECTLECSPPYKNCDGVTTNGCEIPVGQPNTCNRDGLAPFTGQTPPCGTPHCGSSSSSSAADFGTWHCQFCVHCHIFGDGGSWCLYSGGEEGTFSPDRCSDCCNPDQYSEVCDT